MRTIKVFLASSEELRNERLEFADLVLQLNDLFEKRHIQLKLVKWEHLDASMGVKHKQEEYNDKLKECELCLTLYWTKFGDYTAEELETAYNELKEGRNPRKLYVFFKDAKEVTPELQQFKDSFATEYGHFFCKFENVDTMRLQFLLQLEAYHASSADKLLQVENQKVLVEGTPIVDLNNVPFAAMNKEFVRLRDGIATSQNNIEQFNAILSQMENPAIKAMLEAQIAERNKLQEEFDIIQNAILNTAITVAKLKGAAYDDLLQRAIEAFEEGNLERTHTLLQEASLKVAQEREAYKLKSESLEADRASLVKRIKQLLLDAEAVIGVASYPIEERIEKAYHAYNEALLTAHTIGYDKKEYASLVAGFADFADKYAKYDKAQKLYLEHIELSKELYGEESDDLAISYNNIGGVYTSQGDYPQALEYYQKALAIYEKVLGLEHSYTTTSYNNIGVVYDNQGDSPQALEYYQKALAIREKMLGTEHPSTATSYNNIGSVYDRLGDYPLALEYYRKALAIKEKVLGADHPDTATSYGNIGVVYDSQGDYPQAMEYYFKSLAIREKVLGAEHPSTAASYSNIGGVYSSQDDYPQALEYFQKALAIEEKVLGTEHIDTATSYNNIGVVYDSQGDYPQALEYYRKALAIYEKVLGTEHPSTATSYNNIGVVYDSQGDYPQALEYYRKALAIREKVLGTEHIDTATSYNNIGVVYFQLGEKGNAQFYFVKCAHAREVALGVHPDTGDAFAYVGYVSSDSAQALEYHHKALSIRIELYGDKNADTAQSYFDVGSIYIDLKDYSKALENLYKALDIRLNIFEAASEDIAGVYNNIGYTFNEMGEYQKALEAHAEACKIREVVFGCDAVETANSYHHLGKTRNYLESYATALVWLNKALPIRMREFGDEHEKTIATQEQIKIAEAKLNSTL